MKHRINANTEKWDEFSIGEIFEISRPLPRAKNDYDDGDVPFVASGVFNNGVVASLNPHVGENVDKGNCLTVSPLDGHTFYQPFDFLGRGGAGSAIIILRNASVTEYSGLFLAAVLTEALKAHSYIDQISSVSIRQAKVRLPVSASGEPDWSFMESYMGQIMKEEEKWADELETRSPARHEVNSSDWRGFRIGDLFEKLQLGILKPDFNKALDVSEVQNDEFNLPLVNAKHGGNGIMFYGREKDFESAEMTLDIVQNGAIATGDVYAQPQRTGVLWDAYLVKPKDSGVTKNALFFLAAVVERSIKQRFSWADKCIWEKASALSVKLPVKNDGTPDYAFMDAYMGRIMKEEDEWAVRLTDSVGLGQGG